MAVLGTSQALTHASSACASLSLYLHSLGQESAGSEHRYSYPLPLHLQPTYLGMAPRLSCCIQNGLQISQGIQPRKTAHACFLTGTVILDSESYEVMKPRESYAKPFILTDKKRYLLTRPARTSEIVKAKPRTVPVFL